MSTFLETINAVDPVSREIASDVEAFYGGTVVSPAPIPFGKNEVALKVQRVSSPIELTPSSVASCIGNLIDAPATANTAVPLPTFTEKLGNTLIAITATFQAVANALPAVAVATGVAA